jgi:ribosomal RNA small subunit methyltransferase A
MKKQITNMSKESKIRPRKHLGQNFLIDRSILEVIVNAAKLTKDDLVLEIGAGTGTLTEALSRDAGHVVAVEIDERLVSLLRQKFFQYPDVEIVKGDFLQLNLTELTASSTLISEKSKVVANLPYYITSPIILELFRHAELFERLVVLVQKEVAERIVAAPGSKRYGAFSVAVQYHADPEIMAIVPPEAFWPQPKVDSAVVKMMIREAPRVKTVDEEKLREEEKFDGYYAIVTSEWKKTDEEIIEIYRGLWRIEEAFKVTKSDLETRPVYLSRNDHIQAHFLICFVALVIARLLQLRLGNKYTIPKIVESLNKASGSLLEENWYVFNHTDEITEAITETLGIDLSRKYLRLGDIKKLLGATKKA